MTPVRPDDRPRDADLHLHTRYSDGTDRPEELVLRAASHGLSAMALTDHDTVEGCPEAAEACGRLGIEFIPGTELTAEHDHREIHILGYFVDVDSPAFRVELRRFQAGRQDRIRTMISRLNESGVSLRLDTVLSIAKCDSPGRPHIARALVQEGFCKDFDSAFERFLKKGRPGWAPKTRMDAQSAIGLIHGAGGVAVLAHPGLYRADAMIPTIAAMGLDGIECWHTRHDAESSARYEQLAVELDLAPTGGSDCHGMTKGEPLMGRVRIPYARVEELKHRRRPTGPLTSAPTAVSP